jgi:nicotine blue oxidoreductase
MTLREGGATPVIVVTGAADVDLPGVIIAHNPDWRTGMGSSLRVGLGSVPPEAGAVVIALADQPLITAKTIIRLKNEFSQGGAAVVVASYGGSPRNPVLIARPHWPAALAAAAGDAGARAFVRARPDLVTLVECGDVSSPEDLDTPEDLERITRLLEAGGANGEPGLRS